jgi:hypothetical protein
MAAGLETLEDLLISLDKFGLSAGRLPELLELLELLVLLELLELLVTLSSPR